jgi:hypothetical protein
MYREASVRQAGTPLLDLVGSIFDLSAPIPDDIKIGGA